MTPRVKTNTKQENIDYALMTAAMLRLLAHKRKSKESKDE